MPNRFSNPTTEASRHESPVDIKQQAISCRMPFVLIDPYMREGNIQHSRVVKSQPPEDVKERNTQQLHLHDGEGQHLNLVRNGWNARNLPESIATTTTTTTTTTSKLPSSQRQLSRTSPNAIPHRNGQLPRQVRNLSPFDTTQWSSRANTPPLKASSFTSSSSSSSFSPSNAEGRKVLFAQRPRSARTRPINYYPKLSVRMNGAGYRVAAGQHNNDVTSSDSDDGEMGNPNPGDRSPSHVLYSASDVQVVGRHFDLLDEIPSLPPHACYAREFNASSYANEFRMDPTRRILHIDFDRRELAAFLKVLAFCGFRPASLRSDMPLADQVIEAVSAIPEKGTGKHSASRISWIYELSHLVPVNRNDVEAWLAEVMGSKGNRVKRLLARSLGVIYVIPTEKGGQQNDLSQYVGSENFHQLSTCLQDASVLRRRSLDDIKAFLSDAKRGRLATVPCYVEAVPATRGGSDRCRIAGRPAGRGPNNLNGLLRSREVGGYYSNQHVRSSVCRNLRLSTRWKGASNDVVVLTWSPDGTRFAVGATAQCDEHNMEYNRGNNLLLGDLTRNAIKELPDHWIPRPPRPTNRVNMSPRLFMSVTAMQWFGNTLFTANYDRTVKLWDVSSHSDAFCFKTLRHESEVQVMARSNFNKNILATGSNSIGFWDLAGSDPPNYTPLEVMRSGREAELVPTSLGWGVAPGVQNILVAGMSEKDPEDSYMPEAGHLGMWCASESSILPVQLYPNSHNIFDVKWHPFLPVFATASSAQSRPLRQGTLKGTKSVVHIYEPLLSRRDIVEFDCPALDVNDVTFCPQNSNYVTACCTDGATYVWDLRKPSGSVHRLAHDKPLNQTDERLPREQADVGVRVALWGDHIDQFFTGATDGTLKQWNILRSPEDALVENKMNFTEELMSGAFSPDKSNILVGDSAGGVHVVSAGGSFLSNDDNDEMRYEPASEQEDEEQRKRPEELDSDSGVEAARRLLSSGRLVRHPTYGVGQGPHYDGPYASWARSEEVPKEELPTAPLKKEWQMLQLEGEPVEHREGLDEQARHDLISHMRLARIRNRRHNEGKRKRYYEESSRSSSSSGGDGNGSSRLGKSTRNSIIIPSSRSNYINLCSDDEDYDYKPSSPPPQRTPRKRYFKRRLRISGRVITRPEPGVIDLTASGDSYSDEPESGGDKEDEEDPTVTAVVDKELLENLEEDYWWPESGEIDPNFDGDC